MNKAGAWALAAVGSIAIAVIPATSAAESPDPVAARPLKVVLLPIRAYISRVGLVKAEEVSEWSALARANLDGPVESLITQSPALSLTALPAMSADELKEIDEFLAVANLAMTEFGGYFGFGGAGVQRETADRALGPSLSFLRDRTGADFALGTVAYQLEQSKPLAIVGSIVSLNPFAGGEILALPPVTFSYVAMFIADLATGELRWFNVESGYEVAGFNFSDLRDPESVGKMVGKLFEKYPEDPRAEDDREARSPGPTRPASPRQGEFAVQAPAGWTVSDYDNVVRATRDGPALNEMSVELRDHSRSFLEIGRRSTRYSSPEQLAEWFVADLERQKLSDFQLIDVSTGAKLVGKPAFRARYSYRLPDFVGGARVEVMTTGTAVANGLLIARLHAPQLGYFPKALPAFEEAVQSIALKSRRHLQ